VLDVLEPTVYNGKTFYIDTSTWRSVLGQKASKEDKKNNALINKLKKQSKTLKEFNKKKKDLGLKGTRGVKHRSIDFVNNLYPELNLKMKSNDVADALALGLAYLAGCKISEGK
jgi:hypothetical protein